MVYSLLCMLASVFVPLQVQGQVQSSPELRTLSEQEVTDLLVGSCIQSTRGCDPTGYIERAREAMDEGLEFRMVSLEDVPDEWRTVGPAGVGGGGPWEHVIERTEEQGLPTEDNTQLKAIRLLSDYLDDEFNAIIRVEPAGATLSALLTSAQLGVPIVDACMSGRARPEIQQQIPWINGIPSTPTALYTRWGDEIIVQKAVDDYRSEDLARAVAVSSGGGSAIAMNPMTGEQAKRGTIPENLTEAIELGRAVRVARETGEDPIQALLETTGGYLLFRGTVTKSDQRGERGFSWADVELEGTGDFEGHTYSVFVKNENIVGWLDGEVDLTSPDYMYNLDPETGMPITGGGLGGYPLGRDVVLIGVAAHDLWRTPEGIEVLGPRHFGFDFDYTPLDELQNR